MIRAILFDLDGTLTVMDQDEFMRNYVGLLAPRFAHLIAPDKFAKQVMKSFEVMIKEPKSGKTNIQNFFEDFTKQTGLTYNTLWPIFEEFYIQDFPAMQCLVKQNQEATKAVEIAIQQGYIVAVAANPVMPLIAIKERIRWADLSPEQFTVIPDIETFHFCKPFPDFYTELATRLGCSPRECLMVGNHPIEDLAGKKIGMKTFLLGRPSENTETDYWGEASDLVKLIMRGSL